MSEAKQSWFTKLFGTASVIPGEHPDWIGSWFTKLFGTASVIPGEHPDWIGKRLEALAKWLDIPAQTPKMMPKKLPVHPY